MQPERNTKRPDADLLERPLTARSLVASLLLGMRPPRLSGARLVRWCGLFGIAEGTARVALSRMVDRGELRAGHGVYELHGRIRARQPAQEWSLDPELVDARGEWRIAVVDGGRRSPADRAALRDAMRRLRMAEAREGVWTRPANLPRAAAPSEDGEVAKEQCSWWTGRPDEDPRALAERLFDPQGWSARAVELDARLDAVTNALDGGDDRLLAHAFVAGAAALAHIRADPLLPAELCGPRWPGAELRKAYARYQRGFAASVHDWFRSS